MKMPWMSITNVKINSNEKRPLDYLLRYTEAISVGEKLYQFIEPFGMLSVKPEISSTLTCKIL